MATSGNIEKKFHGGSTGGYYIGIDWKVNSQSVSGNSSNVTATFYIRTSGNGYTISSSASKNVTLTINGTKYSGTAKVGMGANTKKNLLSKTVTVNHNSDGTKTCSFACSGVFGLTLSGKYYGTVSHSGNGTFNTINLNSAPRWTSDDTRMNDIRSHVIIPENWNSVTVTSSTATDNEQGGNLHYDIHRYINGVYSAQIKAGGSNLSVTDNIGSWGQGTRIKYEAKVHDGSLWASGSRWSWEYTKNTFGRAAVDNVGSITAGTQGLTFRAYGISNSGAGNGYVNTEFGYRMECLTPGVSIQGSTEHYQNNQGDVNFVIGIKNNGGNPTNPHWIDANQLKAVFRDSNYCGEIRLRLTSWNSYGSSGYFDFSVWVDLRQNPPWTSIRYGANNKINFNGTDYYIPAHLPFYLEWDAVSDPVEGNACTYDVLYQIGEESWVHLGSTSSTNYIAYLGNTAIGNRKINNFRMIVRAKTRYGYYSDTGATRISLWDYSVPTVRVSSINRTKDKVTISGQITTNTSIPGNTASGEHYRWHGESNIGFTASGSGATKSFTLNIAAAQNKSGNIHIASSDLVMDKLSAIISKQWGNIDVAVKAYMPIMSMNKFGVGIGTRLANSNYVFEVDGNANVKGKLYINGSAVANASHTHNNIVSRGNVTCETGTTRPAVNGLSMGQVYNNSYPTTYGNVLTLKGQGDSQLLLGWSGTNGAHAPAYIRSKRDVGDANWSGWAQIYTTAHKPSASDIGALSLSGGTMTGGIQLHNTANSWLGGSTAGNLKGYKQSSGSFHPIISQTTSNNHKIALGGLGDDFGFYMYDANRTENGIDGYFKFVCNIKEIESGCVINMGNHLKFWNNNALIFATHGGGWFMSDSSWIRAYNNKNIYTAGTVQGWTSRARYFKALDSSNNVDFEFDRGEGYFNVYSGSGAGIVVGRPWSGSSGTEPALYNNKGNGWGFIGNSGSSWFRVYGAGGSVSDRNKKYHITKALHEEQYENVKNLNIYNYRTISTSNISPTELAEKHLTHSGFMNEEGKYVTTSVIVEEIEYKELEEGLSQDEIKELRIKEIIEKNPHFSEVKRQDLMLGAMVDELPTEVTFYDNEGGDGKAVDMYSYTTMVAGATKHLINKVETLEKENKIKDNKISELEQRLEKMEELLNGIINKG